LGPCNKPKGQCRRKGRKEGRKKERKKEKERKKINERRKESGLTSICVGRGVCVHKLVTKISKSKNVSLYLPIRIPRKQKQTTTPHLFVYLEWLNGTEFLTINSSAKW
jgi:hypothetical protein